jgi:hypothetical protein
LKRLTTSVDGVTQRFDLFFWHVSWYLLPVVFKNATPEDPAIQFGYAYRHFAVRAFNENLHNLDT